MLHKRRGVVLTCLGVSLAIAVLYNYTTRPVYEATTQILIDRDTPNVLPNKELVDLGAYAKTLTSMQLAEANEKTKTVVDDLLVAVNDQKTQATKEVTTIQRSAFMAFIVVVLRPAPMISTRFSPRTPSSSGKARFSAVDAKMARASQTVSVFIGSPRRLPRHPPGHRLLGEAVVPGEHLEGLGLLDGVQVGALQVLHQGQLQGLPVAGLGGGSPRHPGQCGGARAD